MKIFDFFKRLKNTRKLRHKNYLKNPDFTLKEEHFFVQSENFPTGLWRASRIFYEYMRGFYVFKDVKNCITVFGSARFDENHMYYRMARLIGKTIAEHGFTVMTGGGPGIMEAANRGAKEANGVSISCNIRLPQMGIEFPNAYVDKRITMHYFFVRKVMLTKYSVAFVVMPGGLGTLDELFEVTTLIQTGKLKNFPVILMGKDYWQPLMDFMVNTLLKTGTIYQSDVERLLITDSPEETLAHVHKYLNGQNHHAGRS
jgi:uncharacterized protein (TIGR00730 family)